MKILFLQLCIILTISLLSGCSGAANGYGKKGVGLVGSAYGYTDKKISSNSWFIEYVGADSAEASKGSHKRALEICKENGFSGTSFSPKGGVTDDLVIYSGVSKCLSKNALAQKGKTPESTKIINRVKQIDVELAAIKEEKKSNKAQEERIGNLASSTGTTNVFALNALEEAIFGNETQERLDKLKAERAVLINKLKIMSQ